MPALFGLLSPALQHASRQLAVSSDSLSKEDKSTQKKRSQSRKLTSWIVKKVDLSSLTLKRTEERRRERPKRKKRRLFRMARTKTARMTKEAKEKRRQKKLKRQLCWARVFTLAQLGQAEEVFAAVDKYPYLLKEAPKEFMYCGATLVMAASRSGNAELVEGLIDREGPKWHDIDAVDVHQNMTAFDWAAHYGNLDVCLLLARRGAYIYRSRDEYEPSSIENYGGRSTLDAATIAEHKEFIEGTQGFFDQLVNHALDGKCNTVLATLEDCPWLINQPIAMELERLHEHMMSYTVGPHTILYAAIMGGQAKLVSALLDLGSTLEDGDNPLFAAIDHDELEVCKVLLSRGADLLHRPTWMERDNGSMLDSYGSDWDHNPADHPHRPRLSNEVKEKRRRILQEAYERGPLALERKREANWVRRGSFVCAMAGLGFQPLVARSLEEAVKNPPLPTTASLPPIPTKTEEEKRSKLHNDVFGHVGIWRRVASFL